MKSDMMVIRQPEASADGLYDTGNMEADSYISNVICRYQLMRHASRSHLRHMKPDVFYGDYYNGKVTIDFSVKPTMHRWPLPSNTSFTPIS
jgi:hypothetical protein